MLSNSATGNAARPDGGLFVMPGVYTYGKVTTDESGAAND